MLGKRERERKRGKNPDHGNIFGWGQAASLKSLEDVLLGEFECRSDLADTHLTHPVANLDTVIQALAHGMSGQEASSESVTSTVGVDNLIVRELGDRVDLGVFLARVNVARQV